MVGAPNRVASARSWQSRSRRSTPRSRLDSFISACHPRATVAHRDTPPAGLGGGATRNVALELADERKRSSDARRSEARPGIRTAVHHHVHHVHHVRRSWLSSNQFSTTRPPTSPVAARTTRSSWESSWSSFSSSRTSERPSCSTRSRGGRTRPWPPPPTGMPAANLCRPARGRDERRQRPVCGTRPSSTSAQARSSGSTLRSSAQLSAHARQIACTHSVGEPASVTRT